jgi:ketosteroid isomerase-like protein
MIQTLVERHLATLVGDNKTWLTLIDDDLIWEFPYANSVGLPSELKGRAQVTQFVAQLLLDVKDFEYYAARTYPFADGAGAAVEVSARGTFRQSRKALAQDYVLLLQSRDNKIVHLTEYFDPIRLAKGLGLLAA